MIATIQKRNLFTLVAFALAAVLVICSFAVIFYSSTASAAEACKLGEDPQKTGCIINICKAGQDPGTDDCIPADQYQACDPALGKCGNAVAPSTSGTTAKCDLDCIINRYVNPIINFLSIMVGLVVTIAITVGGVQYSSAGGDPQKVAKAKSRITNGILALLAFLFLWVFLQWVVPGGFL